MNPLSYIRTLFFLLVAFMTLISIAQEPDTQATNRDFNGDGKADIVWRKPYNGQTVIYFQDDTQRLSYAFTSHSIGLDWKLSAIGDFNGDDKADIVWRDQSNGATQVHFMNGSTKTGESYTSQTVGLNWNLEGAGDFNGDGLPDLVWRKPYNGQVIIHFMDGLNYQEGEWLDQQMSLEWELVGLADFNQDGLCDIAWRSVADGSVVVHYMDGGELIQEEVLENPLNKQWKVVGTDDYDGDGNIDILWRKVRTGETVVQHYEGIAERDVVSTSHQVATNWNCILDSEVDIINVAGGPTVRDFDGDGKNDILWRRTDGKTLVYFMDDAERIGGTFTSQTVGLDWEVGAIGDFNQDRRADIMWRNTSTGATTVHFMEGEEMIGGGDTSHTVALNWKLEGAGDFNRDGKADLVWRRKADGKVVIHLMNGLEYESAEWSTKDVSLNWELAGIADCNEDGLSDIVWRRVGDGTVAIHYMDGGEYLGGIYTDYPVNKEWEMIGAEDYDGDLKADILWRRVSDGVTVIQHYDGEIAQKAEFTSHQVATNWAAILDSETVLNVVGDGTANPVDNGGDGDFDGLVDAWEIQYFGDLSQGPNDDFDGDGVLNHIEMDWNFDPNNENDGHVILDATGDTFSGGDHGEYIVGNIGNDVINSMSGNDVIFGGDGNDRLISGLGDDILVGEKGDDTLEGGDGDDEYHWNWFDGDDVIDNEISGTDRIVFLDGTAGFDEKITPEKVSLYRVSKTIIEGNEVYQTNHNGSDLRISINTYFEQVAYYTGPKISGSVVLPGYYDNPQRNKVEYLYFQSAPELGNIELDSIELSNTYDPSLDYDGDGVSNGVESEWGFDPYNEDDGHAIIDPNGAIYSGKYHAEIIFGGEGNDRIYAAGGNDVVFGGDGNDSLTGASEDDILYGGLGDDELFGGNGNDILRGGKGNDVLQGGNWGDIYEWTVGDGRDLIYEFNGSGIDELRIYGASSDNVEFKRGALKSNGGHKTWDEITQFNHDLMIWVKSHSEEEFNVNEVEWIVIKGWYFWFPIDGYHQVDKIRIMEDAIEYSSDNGFTGLGDLLYGFGDSDDVLTGSEGNDQLRGSRGDDILYGNGGDDVIYGDEDDDIIYGGKGNDSLHGGTGNDIYEWEFGDGRDHITEINGIDELRFIGVKSTDIEFRRGSMKDLDGEWRWNEAVDDNYDLLIWVKNSPIHEFDEKKLNEYGWVVIHHWYAGANTVEKIVMEGDNVVYLGTQPFTGLGDFLHGTDAIDDILEGGSGNQSIYGHGGNDNLSGMDGNDELYGGNGNDILYGGYGNDELYGGYGNDELYGGYGNDILDGGPGNNSIEGGKGDDDLTGSSGDDNYIYNIGDGLDTIRDPGGADTITLVGDYELSEIRVSRGEKSIVNDQSEFVVNNTGNDLLIYRYNWDTGNSQEVIIVEDFYLTHRNSRIEHIRFVNEIIDQVFLLEDSNSDGYIDVAWDYTDIDGDGLLNWEEIAYGSKVEQRDSNNDGIEDFESYLNGFAWNDNDWDNDGLLNQYEVEFGTSLHHKDTDGDGVLDPVDDYPNDSTRATSPTSSAVLEFSIQEPTNLNQLN